VLTEVAKKWTKTLALPKCDLQRQEPFEEQTLDVEKVRTPSLSSFRAYIHYFLFIVFVEKREKMTQVIMRGYEKHTMRQNMEDDKI
jgi:hypothetical protein